MQFSGYDEIFREKVVTSARKAIERIIIIKKSEWFYGKVTKNETVVFVQAPPGCELKKRYLKTIQRAKVKVAVV